MAAGAGREGGASGEGGAAGDLNEVLKYLRREKERVEAELMLVRTGWVQSG